MSGARTDPREASCQGKEPYPNGALAFRVAKRRTSKDARRKLQVYRCRFCGLWHHGTARKDGKS